MSKSAGEEELAFQLKAAKIEFTREQRFHPTRQWRFDFVAFKHLAGEGKAVAVEIEGGAFNGGHRRGAEANKDCEKSNAAVLAGWKVLRFTPYMVETGEAIEVIEAALKAPA